LGMCLLLLCTMGAADYMKEKIGCLARTNQPDTLPVFKFLNITLDYSSPDIAVTHIYC
jgi:hypothetical protein